MSPPAEISSSVSPWAVFRHRNYAFLQIAKSFTTLGFFMEVTTTGYQVYALTKEQLYLGLLGLAYFLPAIFFALATGYVADRFDRARVAQVCQAGMFVVAGALAWIAFHTAPVDGSPSPPGALSPHTAFVGISCVILCSGAFIAFYRPSVQAMVPSLVPHELLRQAITWNSTLWQVMAITGPALGGLVLAKYGARGTYILEMCFAVAAMACMSFVRARPEHQDAAAGGVSWDRVLAGLRFIRSRPILVGAISLDLFAVLLGGAAALLPVYAQDILHVGGKGFGILRASPAIGAGIMSIALALLPTMKRAGRAMLFCVAMFGVTTIAFGLSRNFAFSVFCLIVMGASDMVSIVVRHTLVQAMTPPAMRGRVSAVNVIFVGASNELGEFESGTLAHYIGTVPTVVVGGIGTLIVVGAWAVMFPDLRKFGSLDAATYKDDPEVLNEETKSLEASTP